MDRDILMAEEKLAEMREEYGITLLSDIDTGTAAIRSGIVQLTADTARTEMIANIKKSKYEKIVELSPEVAAGTLGFLAGDQSLQPLIAEKQKLEMTATVQKQAGLGPNHPSVVQNESLLGYYLQNLRTCGGD